MAKVAYLGIKVTYLYAFKKVAYLKEFVAYLVAEVAYLWIKVAYLYAFKKLLIYSNI